MRVETMLLRNLEQSGTRVNKQMPKLITQRSEVQILSPQPIEKSRR
jgi:hypothetical protein